MLVLEKVTKRYGENIVVDAIDLTLQAAQTHVLIGQSGCGKSTLIRMLIGLVTPDSGQVLLDGQPLQQQNIDAVRQRYGYVIQEGGLFPHLTARDNITLAARFLNRDPAHTTARVEELARLTQFPQEGLDRFPKQLSGGQRQRVSLMRALLLEPDILLLDEPLGALDPMIRNELQQQLKQIFLDLEITVVMVTHDLHEAAYFGHQIVLLKDGRIVQRGTASELLNNPQEEFVTQFIRAQRSHLEGAE